MHITAVVLTFNAHKQIIVMFEILPHNSIRSNFDLSSMMNEPK